MLYHWSLHTHITAMLFLIELLNYCLLLFSNLTMQVLDLYFSLVFKLFYMKQQLVLWIFSWVATPEHPLIYYKLIIIDQSFSNVYWFEFALRGNGSLIVINEFLELILIGIMQFSKAKEPLIDVDWSLVTDCCYFDEIICIFFSFWLWDVVLYVFIESDSLMQINSFLFIEVNIIEYVF